MTWRTVVIQNRCKLEYSMNQLIVRGEGIQKVNLNEISTLLIESTAVSITAALLCEMIRHKIKVIFCDDCYNPCSELVPYAGCHDSADAIRRQITWTQAQKEAVWTVILKNKIEQQRNHLRALQLHAGADKIDSYLAEFQHNDATNREGMAARIYFNSLFGVKFTRENSQSSINKALNYGYAILLSAFNREISANGYILQLGLHHNNQFNAFNLSCDIMEPFRPIVDNLVYCMTPDKFETEEKRKIQDILNHTVKFQGASQVVNYAIGLYCRSVFQAIEKSDPSLVIFALPEYKQMENMCEAPF